MQFKTRHIRVAFPPSLVVAVCLTGCSGLVQAPPQTPVAGAIPAPGPGVPPGEIQKNARLGRPYDVSSSDSLLRILAFRGGALAKAGHNHVIASHDISGTFYVPDDVLRSTFELHIPVAQLTIDEPGLRTQEGADFPTEVPESAKEGTRKNMLSDALLSGAQYPELTLVSQQIEPGSLASSVRANVLVTVRGQTHTVAVPVSYSLAGGELVASGDLTIKQTDLGLKPFSAMLGALQVQDELRVKFRIVAHAGSIRH